MHFPTPITVSSVWVIDSVAFIASVGFIFLWSVVWIDLVGFGSVGLTAW